MLRYIINRYVLGFVALVILSLVLLNYTGWDREALTPIERMAKDAVFPVEKIVNDVFSRTGETVGAVFSINRLLEENKDFARRVSELESENIQLKGYAYQNMRLRELLQFRDSVSSNYEMVSASVVGRNPSNWFQTVTINKGEDDGVIKNMAVVTNKGLVGHVVSTTKSNSEVLLIIDNTSSVGGLIQVSRTVGVVKGMATSSGADKSGYLKLDYLSKESPASKNQVVVSSGLGGIFPKELPIGRITIVEVKANGLEKYAMIKPFVDFSRLEEVLVIKKVIRDNEPPQEVETPAAGGN